MRTIDRYLLREFLIPFFYCVAGLLLFWVLFDLFEDLERFRGFSILQIGYYYLIRAPELLVTSLPIALLLALLYALSNHARHNELLALRAIGLSLLRISAPYYVVGLGLTFVLYFLNELLVPNVVRRAEELLAESKKGTAATRWVRDVSFFNQLEHRTWHVALYDRKLRHMWGVLLEWQRDDGTTIRLGALEGIYTNGSWLFQNVKVLEFDPEHPTEYTRYETNQVYWPEINEPPAVIESEIEFSSTDPLDLLESRQLTARQLLLYYRLHPQLPPDLKACLLTQIHARLAEPWACTVVVVIAVPLAATARRSTVVTVSYSLILIAAYFFLTRLLAGFGSGGHLPPWLAAWAPNFLFLITGILMHRWAR